MTLPAPTYDLVLLLDMQAEADARAKIVTDTRATIESQGELTRYDEWGERALTYPIEKKTSAEYHLFQFHVGDVALLSGLDRTLRITDGVLRFRIVKLAPGVPEAPNMSSGAAAAPAEAPQSGETPAAAVPDGPEPAETAPAAETPTAEEPAPATEAPEAEAETETAPEAPVAEPA
jgi:small subunit ribosomal protein S6